jgi:hypothetical protein
MYQRYLADPMTVDPAWHDFFADYRPGEAGSQGLPSQPTSAIAEPQAPARTAPNPGVSRTPRPVARDWDVFICYRRADSEWAAGRIRDALAQRLGDRRIFFDTDSIPAGRDFVTASLEAVASSARVIVVIGRRWLADHNGSRRSDENDDLVRREIEVALRSADQIIPVLVEAATMPRSASLPASIAEFSRRNALRIEHDTFQSAIAALALAISS